MTTYEFDKQLAVGHSGESALDAFFGRWYIIRPATAAQQRAGIDRIWEDRKTKRVMRVEYKTDRRAGRTGNAFIETASVVVDGVTKKQGWALTSQADVLVYYIPEPEAIYLLQLDDVRRALPGWMKQHLVRQIPNSGYYTEGVVVPLREFERIAIQVY